MIGGIAGQVAIQFAVPEIRVRSRSTLSLATIVAVPKASLNQYDGAVATQNQVGRTGQLADVEPISKAGSPHRPPNKSLGRSAPVADTGHEGGAAFLGEEVAHLMGLTLFLFCSFKSKMVG